MSEQESIDVGRVIGLIMENPEIIEQISSLVKQKDTPTETPSENTEPAVSKQASAEPQLQSNSPSGHTRGHRTQLLGALKPYVSEERARAIDSMISIADILDMMKAR